MKKEKMKCKRSKSKIANSRIDLLSHKSQLVKSRRSNSRIDLLSHKSQLVKSRRSQITIFVIVAIVLVLAIAGIFMLNKDRFFGVSAIEDPKLFIQGCVSESAEEALELIQENSGYVSVQSPSLRYDDKDLSYLCYTPEKKELCSNLNPMLVNHIEQEILSYVSPRINNCFNALKSKLQDHNYQEEPEVIEVIIAPDSLIIQIDKEVSFTKNEKTIKIDKFDTVIYSQVYDFARLTNQIINQEVSCDCLTETCNADVVQLSRSNPGFELERFVTSRNEEVYTIREASSGKEFMFAIRNCIRI
jgi:hypothetical protein